MKRYLCALLICSSCIEGLPSAQTMSFTGELVGPPTYDKSTLAGELVGPPPARVRSCEDVKADMERVAPDCNLEVLRGVTGPFCDALDAFRTEFTTMKC